jgi:hypothetical protein
LICKEGQMIHKRDPILVNICCCLNNRERKIGELSFNSAVVSSLLLARSGLIKHFCSSWITASSFISGTSITFWCASLTAVFLSRVVKTMDPCSLRGR